MLDLGMAHGIAGPLALLSLCWRNDLAVPGQERAINAIVDWLRRWVIRDEYGPRWPATVTVRQETGIDETPPTAARDAWCYGAGGIAVALMHAGNALGQSQWSALAVDAVLGAIRRRVAPSAGLTVCHGDAGLLQCACRIAELTGNEPIRRAAAALADEIAVAADPAAPFLYRHGTPAGAPVDSPGMLTGAAGVGCALLSAEALDNGIASRWDEALLLS